MEIVVLYVVCPDHKGTPLPPVLEAPSSAVCSLNATNGVATASKVGCAMVAGQYAGQRFSLAK